MNNPYTLTFGREPSQFISRLSQTEEIYRNFTAEDPSQQIYMITGVRGSGKTVLMTELLNTFRKEKDWIAVELNPANDLLLSLASKLYNDMQLTHLFKNASIDLSFWGIGIHLENTDPVTDIEVALSRMLQTLKKHGKRVLIAIDEVAESKEMRVFAGAYQIFVRNDLPVFLIMTGLYENIDALQNNKILTFLYRAPKIKLGSLNAGQIIRNYKNTFDISEEDACKMAALTNGFPFAFQVLGYFTFENKGNYQAAISIYRQYLDEYVYDKIWSELSAVDKSVVYAIAESKSGKVSEIREKLKMDSNELSPYRTRLIKKGLINGEERGYLSFTLPCFKEYALEHKYY